MPKSQSLRRNHIEMQQIACRPVAASEALRVPAASGVYKRSHQQFGHRIPENPYPPNLGGEDFTPQIWGVTLQKSLVLQCFLRVTS